VNGAGVVVIAIAIVVWTAFVDVLTWWVGLWEPDDAYDPGAVQAAIGSGLFITSGLWVAGAIVVVAVVALLVRRNVLR
jgi:hypothetical protein